MSNVKDKEDIVCKFCKAKLVRKKIGTDSIRDESRLKFKTITFDVEVYFCPVCKLVYDDSIIYKEGY